MTGNGVSFKEQAANRMERQGRILNAAQIEGMRKVCRVGSTSHSRPSPAPPPPPPPFMLTFAPTCLARKGGTRHCGFAHPARHHHDRD